MKVKLEIGNNGRAASPNTVVEISGLETVTDVTAEVTKGTFENNVWYIGTIEKDEVHIIELTGVLNESTELVATIIGDNMDPVKQNNTITIPLEVTPINECFIQSELILNNDQGNIKYQPIGFSIKTGKKKLEAWPYFPSPSEFSWNGTDLPHVYSDQVVFAYDKTGRYQQFGQLTSELPDNIEQMIIYKDSCGGHMTMRIKAGDGMDIDARVGIHVTNGDQSYSNNYYQVINSAADGYFHFYDWQPFVDETDLSSISEVDLCIELNLFEPYVNC